MGLSGYVDPNVLKYSNGYIDQIIEGTSYAHAPQQVQRNPTNGAFVTGDGYLAQGQRRQDISRYTKEAEHFKSQVENYLSGNGKHLLAHLEKTGRSLDDLVGYGSMDLRDDAVAAYVSFQNSGQKYGMIVSNGSGDGFEKRVSKLAKNYLLDKASAKEYVIAHEMMHAAGYDTEASCEKALSQYFSDRARSTEGDESQRYQALSDVASARHKIQSGKATYVSQQGGNYKQ